MTLVRRRSLVGSEWVASKYPTWKAAVPLSWDYNPKTRLFISGKFFCIRVTSDVVHGERGSQIVERYAATPAKQSRAIQLVQRAA